MLGIITAKNSIFLRPTVWSEPKVSSPIFKNWLILEYAFFWHFQSVITSNITRCSFINTLKHYFLNVSGWKKVWRCNIWHSWMPFNQFIRSSLSWLKLISIFAGKTCNFSGFLTFLQQTAAVCAILFQCNPPFLCGLSFLFGYFIF